MGDTSKDTAKLSQWAKEIVAMEKQYDSSMRGVWLDKLITDYVSELGNDFCDMFDYIMEHQKEAFDSYGDFDESVTKLKVTGLISKYPDYDYSASAFLLKDIFCGNMFIIVKIVSQHKELSKMNEVDYHVRKVTKSVKSIALNKLMTYGDTRDEGYVVSFKRNWYRNKIEASEGRSMAYYYPKFKEAMDALRGPYYELTHPQQ